MISYIFELNRMPSINFMAEIEQFMNSRKEELQELSKTQFELTSRVLAKQEEKREMRKKIDDLRHFFNLIATREVLENDIAAQESRILQLRGQLKNPRPAADPNKKAGIDAGAAD
jgi:TolA-binding protein